MTTLLDEAIARARALSPEDQDRLALWLLEEMKDDAEWDRQFGESLPQLARLADQARQRVRRGEVDDIDAPAEE